MPNSSLKSTDCPYAVALLSKGGAHHVESDGSVQSAEDNEDLLAATRMNCPAFADAKGCPFKNASSPDKMKETLLKIPSSHYEMSSFMQVLQGLHTASGGLTGDAYVLPGGCPLPQDIKSDVVAAGGFRHVLEDMSLAAVMARMAEEFERSQSDQNAEVSSPTATAAPVTPIEETFSSTTDNYKPQTRLSTSLKMGTAVAHQAAENVHFVKNFVRGEIDRHLYSKMVLSLYHVYVALEEALEVHGPIQFSQCHFPKQLNRTLTLKDDVDFWRGNDEGQSRPSPATVDYVNRIRDLAEKEPLLLLAHSYTRYLGDLSGGKVLERVARRALHLERSAAGGPTDGLAFYHFEHIPSAKLFKDKYRKALDDLPLTAEQIRRLVQEANVAFLLNMRLFEELDVEANVEGSTVRPLKDVLRMGPDHPDQLEASSNNRSHGAGASAEKCPFMMEKKATALSIAEKSMLSNPDSTKARCPWPFVAFHDPVQFSQDWQTWLMLGILLCWLWSCISR